VNKNILRKVNQLFNTLDVKEQLAAHVFCFPPFFYFLTFCESFNHVFKETCSVSALEDNTLWQVAGT